MITNPIVEIHSPSARIRDVNIATRQTLLPKPGEDFVHTIITQMVRGIHVIHQDARLVICNGAGKCRCVQRSGNEVVLLWPDIFSKEIPGDRPIESTRVDINKTEPPGKLSRDAAFSRRSGAINGDHTTRASVGSM